MLFEIDLHSGKPPYLQIVEQARIAMAGGVLRDGDRLPSVRELAETLRINRNTVAKAYGELEHEGLVETRQGSGVFVTGRGSPLAEGRKEELLGELIDAAVVRAHQFGVKDADFVALVRERLREFAARRKAS